MKVAILNPTLPAYKKDFFENLNVRLRDKELELTLMYGSSFFKKNWRSIENPGYDTIRLDAVEFNVFGFRLAWWKRLLRQVNRLKPDIVIINFNPGNITFLILQIICYFKKIQVGLWSCGYVRKEIKGVRKGIRDILHNFFLIRADFNISYGTGYRNTLLNLGLDKSKVFVAQNTVNTEKILALDYKKEISRNEIIFLFVGALVEEKNLDLAIKAFSRLVQEGHDVRFNIIGNGALIDKLNMLVNKEEMQESIFILGPKYDKELASYFFEADVFILPGSGGLAVNEAMAYGLPVISTNGDGTVTDLLVEGENGYLLEDSVSVESIYSSFNKVLKHDRSQLIKMGMKSKQIIREKATLEHMISGFESAIDYAVNKKR